MADMILGTEGYARFQKEADYGTGVTSAMTLLPILPGTEIIATRELVPNEGIMTSRMNPAPELGKKLVKGNILMDGHPGLIGPFMNFMFGAASNSSAEGDGAYNHYWLPNLTAERIGVIFTLQMAQGNELADQFVSCMIHKMTISINNEGFVKYNFEFTGYDWTTNVARITSFTYPALIPFNFGHCTVSEATYGTLTGIDQLEIVIDLNMEIDRFKLGSLSPARHTYMGRSKPVLTMTLDANQQWIDDARAHTSRDFIITLTGDTDQAGSTPTYYSTAIEFPGCRLNPETIAPNVNERIKMDLEFDCSYGGVPTNGGSTSYMYEIRVTDAAASYTAD